VCLLIAKPKGVNLPPKEHLLNGFEGNPDGAGFAVAKGRHILIKKGYTSFARFYHEFRSSVRKEDGAIIHFRLATHGHRDGANCHPFPLTDREDWVGATKLRTRLPVVGHNGTIGGYAYAGRWSDTAQFVMEVLSQPEVRDSLGKDSIQRLISHVGGKFAFLWPDGSILWIGSSIEENGILYSNHSYKFYKYYGDWDWPRRGRKRFWGAYSYRDDDEEYIPLESANTTARRERICEICGRFREDVVYRSDAAIYACDDCYLTEILGFYDPVVLPPPREKEVKYAEE